MNTRPYWISSAELADFPPLSSDLEVDVVVIGAGLTGITTAHLLKKSGAKVALLERQRCAGADSGHTTAHLTYVTDERLHRLVKVFGRDAARAFWEAGIEGIDRIFEITKEQRIECEFRWVPGFLHGSLKDGSQDDRAGLEEDAQLAEELGFEAEFLESVPYARKPGIRFANQGKFHPIKYLDALLRTLPGKGSHVFENTEVTEVESGPLTIHAGNFKVRCSYLVIATHNPLMGKTKFIDATLFQSKLALYTSYVLGARLPLGLIPEALFWDTTDPYYYLRVEPRSDHDYVIFGGEDVKTGQEDNAQEVFGRLEKQLLNVLPQAQVQDRWLGQVVETNDGLPFIGESAGKQFIATGFCGNGFTLGTLSAVMARDRFLGRKNPWFDLFAVDRKKFHGGTWRYIKENLDYPFYLLRDRLAGAESDSVDDLKIGEGKIIRLEGKKVAAFRDEDGKVTLCSPVCTHLKCIVHWNTADKTWDCPCHGSRFKPTGEVFSGPAEEPLEKLSWPERKKPRFQTPKAHVESHG
jgi:glycine/D-amino acid oxidase-like deaminating enzyme/nitrite reductase/ring-hydroxylating ferredoxin subunit